jgi:tRNA(Ile)-lysidine synthase
MPQSSVSTEFLTRLEAALRAEPLSGEKILVAVSGGADSVALLRGLAFLADNLDLTCLTAHINHGLRGVDSDADADWVAALAQQLGIEFHLQAADLSERVDAGQSLEEAARNARYELLTEIATTASCSIVAVAHTADDQTETILHHLIRGTGLAGLSGMPTSRLLRDGVRLFRPLLGFRRSQIEAWLTELGQDFRTDSSNEDRGFTRNRIRHDLLPLLEEQFNPAFRQVLASLSDQAAEAAAYLRRQAEELATRVVQSTTLETLRIDCSVLQSVDAVLVRETLRVIWSRTGWPLKRMGYREWQRLADLVVEGTATNLPGQIDARRRGSLLVLTRPSSESVEGRP